MKYTQMVMGLLIGTALGGSVIALTGTTNPTTATPSGAVNADAVRKIVRETITAEPELIIQSVQKYQEAKHAKDAQGASDALKDANLRAQVYDTTHAATVGPADSKRVIVEFFDYNCPACKMEAKAFQEIVTKDKTVRIIFREYPIFGPVSENNSRLGLAVARLSPEKYFAFYEKMMGHQGHAEEKDTLAIIKDLGLDVEKVKAESQTPAVAEILEANSKLGDALHIQGTPTLVVGNEIIPHAASPEELLAKLGAAK